MFKFFGLALPLALCASLLAQQAKPNATAPPGKKSGSAAAGAKAEPVAVIHTTAGTLRCTLFPDKTPKTVANFMGLANGTKDWTNPVSHAKKHGVPLYDGTIFHRVIPNFMIQGGDPAGNGEGDPGYSFEDEIVPSLTFDRPGRLAMANSGPNTNGSQFFITEVPTPHLNGHHTIFGQCDEASDVLVKKIARMPRNPSDDRPLKPVRITHIDVQKPGAATHRGTATGTRSRTTKSTQKPAANPQ
jgi:peptidyl-prolyl cis-trans isomerase A (cyclophilin A)